MGFFLVLWQYYRLNVDWLIGSWKKYGYVKSLRLQTMETFWSEQLPWAFVELKIGDNLGFPKPTTWGAWGSCRDWDRCWLVVLVDGGTELDPACPLGVSCWGLEVGSLSPLLEEVGSWLPRLPCILVWKVYYL